MRQKILLFISILALNLFSVVVAEDGLPALPSSVVVEEQVEGEKKPSFLDKLKNFFGFSQDEEDDSVASSAEELDEEDEQQIEEEKKIDLPSELNNSTEEGPVFSQSIDSDSSAFIIEDVSDEPLPKGFGSNQQVLDKNNSDDKPLAKSDNSNVVNLKPSEAIESVEEIDKALESIDVEADEASKSTSSEKPSDLSLPKGFEEFADAPAQKEDDSFIDDSSLNKEVNRGVQGSDQISMASSDEEKVDSSKVTVEQSAENKEVSSDEISDSFVKDISLDKNNENQLLIPDSSISAVEKATAGDEVQLMVPNYVSEAENQVAIEKYTRELKEKKENPQQVEQISEVDFSEETNIDKFTEVTEAELDSKVLEFVNNEAQVLILPDDEVVEGEVTKKARLHMMDLRTYIRFFWLKYEKVKREYRNYKIEEFLDYYEDDLRVNYSEADIITALAAAFKAIDNNNINELTSLLNSYPILHLTGQGKNTLLHEAAYVGNYYAAKLLIMKGINISAKNVDGQTSLRIARKYHNKEIVTLLRSASFKTR